MSGAVDLGHLGQSYADQLRAEMWAIAEQVVYQKLQDHRPRGAASIALTIGAPGAPLVADVVTAQMFVKVHYPIILDECHIVADRPGAAQFDLWVQRPGQIPAQAASIVGAGFPTLGPGQEAIIVPAQVPWTTTYVESGSVISLYLVAVDGVLQVITVNLGSRCV